MAAPRGVSAWIGGRYPRLRLCCAAVLLLYLAARLADCGPEPVYTHAEILAAIRMTESSGLAHPPDGDGGRAIGPYQIHRVYWIDTGMPGDYQDCRRRDYAERVIRAYMLRYVPEAWREYDAETIARTHNGGPTGRHKRATLRYWERVHGWLRRLGRQPVRPGA
jgi:hypothetical protein